jgi:hypothetical protein
MKKKIINGLLFCLFICFIISLFILPVWMMSNNIWPASFLIKVQSKLFNGKYYPRATGAVIFILLVFVILLGSMLISQLKEKIMKRKDKKD